jgi:hypothetical protein
VNHKIEARNEEETMNLQKKSSFNNGGKGIGEEEVSYSV